MFGSSKKSDPEPRPKPTFDYSDDVDSTPQKREALGMRRKERFETRDAPESNLVTTGKRRRAAMIG